MMQGLGRYATKKFLFRRAPTILFSRNLTSSEFNDTLHSQVMARGRYQWRVTPPLDKWLKQGKEINSTDLRVIISSLCESQRFNHALQVSEWITKRGIFDLSTEDFAARLYLVEICSGLREAEKFFKIIPENMRDDSVYTCLLRLYTKSKKTRHEAETTYQKMREQNMLLKPNPYYSMISLYSLLGERNMVDEILRQMKEKGVEHDKNITANNVLKAYASVPDVEAMDKYLMQLDDDEPPFALAWQTGISIAKAYLKRGSSKKAIEILHRTERVVDTKSKDAANKVIMKIYGEAGARLDESRLKWFTHRASKKGKRKRLSAYESKRGGQGDSYYPIYYFDSGGICNGDGGDTDGDKSGGSGDVIDGGDDSDGGNGGDGSDVGGGSANGGGGGNGDGFNGGGDCGSTCGGCGS